MGTGPGVTCNRQQKHIELYSAIEGMSEVRDRLISLQEKIKGTPSKVEEIPAEPRPSLFELLSCGAQRMRDMKEEIIGKINELDDLLF